jgi:hypothetical protein
MAITILDFLSDFFLSSLDLLGLLWRLLIRLHGREKEHLFNVCRVSKQHSQSIDSHAPSSCGRKSIFKCPNKVLVHTLGLIVTICLCSSLIRECFKLDFRVVQLSIGVDQFVTVGKQFEPFGKAFLMSVPLSQGAHQLRVVNDESWANTFHFNELANKLVNEASRGSRRSALNVPLLSRQLFATRKLHTEGFFQTLHHWNSLEGWREVNLINLVGVAIVVLRMVLNLVATVYVLYHL